MYETPLHLSLNLLLRQARKVSLHLSIQIKLTSTGDPIILKENDASFITTKAGTTEKDPQNDYHPSIPFNTDAEMIPAPGDPKDGNLFLDYKEPGGWIWLKRERIVSL